MDKKNAVLIEVLKDICENCKKCTVAAKDIETGANFLIESRYCNNGSGFIDIDLYDKNGAYLESCKLNSLTDSCYLPYNLVIDDSPDCGCD
jgi:hypothetical protein